MYKTFLSQLVNGYLTDRYLYFNKYYVLTFCLWLTISDENFIILSFKIIIPSVYLFNDTFKVKLFGTYVIKKKTCLTFLSENKSTINLRLPTLPYNY